MKRRPFFVIGYFAALCALAYAPALLALLQGNAPLDGDALSAFGPWREWTRAALWQGTLPLWNPHVFCGMPFLANGQSAVLYPFNVVYAVLPLFPALFCDAYFHNVLLACGGYALARALGLSRLSALLTGTLLALGGAVSARVFAGHMTWHAARAWIPWLLWATLLFARHGKPRHALGAALFTALLISAGHPPVALLGLSLSVFMLAAILITRGIAGRVSFSWQWALGGVLLAILLCAATLLPLQEASRFAVRSKGLPYSFAVIGSGSWQSFVRLLLPDFFGGNHVTQWSQQFWPHEEAASIGLLPALLALGAIYWARVPHNGKWRLPRAVPWLWVAMLLAALLSLGESAPFYRFAFDHLPFFKSLRVPVRWLELWFLCAALLAGFSFEGCRRRLHDSSADNQPHGARRSVAALAIVCALFAALCFGVESWLMSTAPESPLWMQTAQWNAQRAPERALQAAERLRWAAVFSALGGGVLAASAAFLVWQWSSAKTRSAQRLRWEIALCLLMSAELLGLFWRSTRTVEAARVQTYVTWPPAIAQQYQPGQRWDTALAAQWGDYAWNSGVPRGVDLFSGYDPFGPLRYFYFASALEGNDFLSYQYQPQRRTSLLRVAGVTHTLRAPDNAKSPLTTEFGAPARVAVSDAWALWRHEGAWPRVYLSDNVQRAAPEEQLALLEKLSADDFAAQNQPVVAAPAAFPDVKNAAAPANKILNWQRGWNRIDVATQIEAPAVLVCSENHYVGWRAYLSDGTAAHEAPVDFANYLFRGVEVPRGTRRVTLVYEPQTLRVALFLSLLGVGAATATGITLWGRKRHD